MSKLSMVTFVMFLGALAGGCSSVCDEAGDKLAECFPSDGSDPPPDTAAGGDQAECSGNAECVAGCMSSATCSELEAAFAAEENDYTRCAAKCQ